METIHTFETSVQGLKNIDGKDTDVSYNFLGEVYDEPCVKTVEHGNFFTKVTSSSRRQVISNHRIMFYRRIQLTLIEVSQLNYH